MAQEQSESGFDDNTEIFSEYYEDNLDADKRAAFEKRMADDAEFAAAYQDFVKTMDMLSGLHKMSAPMDFDKKVEDTIHRRSGGRFFGRRAFGDRIPFEILAIVVMLIAAAVYWMGRTSGTGGHKLSPDEPPAAHDDDRDVVPHL